MLQLIVPPIEGGVYDFSSILQAKIGDADARLVPLSKDTPPLFFKKDDTIFLQYSGYGYDNRGIPLWLLKECRRLHKEVTSFGIFFHELYAMSSPRHSAFWLSPLQKYIAKELLMLCDFWMTSRQESEKCLLNITSDKPHAVLPVYSTIGENPVRVIPPKSKIVVFGSVGVRQTTYLAAMDKLFVWAGAQQLEIHDIGAPINDALVQSILIRNGVVQHGRLEADDVCKILLEAEYGLLAYPYEYVAKSSVFSAYCAHTICPILLSENYLDSDGLEVGRHYIAGIPEASMSAKQVKSIAEAARNWYEPHSLSSFSGVLNALILAGKQPP